MATKAQTNDRASSLESLLIYVLILGMIVGAVILLSNKQSTTDTTQSGDRSLVTEDE